MQTAPSIQSTKPRTPTATSYRPIVRRLGRGMYQIGSRTIPGALYTVTLTGLMSYTCTCPAFEYGRGCWHAVAAVQASGFFERWYSQALPVMASAAPLVEASPAAAPTPIPFHQTAGFKALSECFA